MSLARSSFCHQLNLDFGDVELLDWRWENSSRRRRTSSSLATAAALRSDQLILSSSTANGRANRRLEKLGVQLVDILVKFDMTIICKLEQSKHLTLDVWRWQQTEIYWLTKFDANHAMIKADLARNLKRQTSNVREKEFIWGLNSTREQISWPKRVCCCWSESNLRREIRSRGIRKLEIEMYF